MASSGGGICSVAGRCLYIGRDGTVKIFLAGAWDPLGGLLTSHLCSLGHDVRVLSSSSLPSRDLTGVELVLGNLLTADLVNSIDGCCGVIHVTSAPMSAPSEPDASGEQRRLCARGARRLLEAAVACGVSHYVHESTVTAYRGGGERWLDEDAPLDSSPARAAFCTPFIEMETMLRQVEPRILPWTIIRGGSLVGANTCQRVLIDGLRGGTLVVAGDGSNYVSLVSVADMAAGMAAALDFGPAGSAFNVVDEPLRYGDYVDALADLIGTPRPRRVPSAKLPPSWRCTNRAARTVLGWMPRERLWP